MEEIKRANGFTQFVTKMSGTEEQSLAELEVAHLSEWQPYSAEQFAAIEQEVGAEHVPLKLILDLKGVKS